jgi:hypothetical protein
MMGLLDRLFSSKPPSKDQFARQIMAGIKRAGEKRALVYDEDQFQLRTPEKDGPFFNLANAYPEFCAAPKTMRAVVLKRWIRVWFGKEIPGDFEDVRPDLLPSVQARSHYELLDLQFQVEGRGALNRPCQIFAEHFAAGLVYDLPESMQHVNQDTLGKWGVTLYEALELARQNLAEKPFAFLGPSEGEGLWCAMQKDSYAAARILLLDTIRGFRVRGDIVAMVPNREMLLVAGSDDLPSLQGMLRLATEAIQQPRRISGIALRLDGDEWAPWLPDAGHPLYWDFRKLQTQTFGQAYAEQKELLDKLHRQTGEDVFVGSFLGMGREGTNELTSYCVWGKGATVAGLLPRTDLIAFFKQDYKPLLVPWERAAEVVGSLMQPMGMYPERWRVLEFPSDEQLQALGCERAKP